MADLSHLNDSQGEIFRKENFTGKLINKITFKNITFIDCDFTDATIGGCEFFDSCQIISCNFTGASFKGVKFSDTTFEQCTFVKTEFMDVTIESSCNVRDNNWSNDCIINNFVYCGQKIDDITKITSVVECIKEEVEEQYDEEDYNNEDAMKLYNVLFPQILKRYPQFKKETDQNGNDVWIMEIDGIEICVCADEEYNVWRIFFSILNDVSEFGGDYIGGGELTCGLPNKKITFETLKEVFVNVAKDSATKVAEQSSSQIVKNALNKFISIIDRVITQNIFSRGNSVVIDYSLDPEDAIGVLNPGYDFATKRPVIIISKPFTTDNSDESNRVRTLIANGLKFIFGQDDIRNMGLEELTAYAKDHPYSCFVYESNDYYNGRASVRDFGINGVVLLK